MFLSEWEKVDDCSRHEREEQDKSEIEREILRTENNLQRAKIRDFRGWPCHHESGRRP